MKKVRYLYPVWILILSILLQNIAYAEMEQEIINTAPEANFTIEKSRNVKILVLTDYKGTDNANLKNSLTSMKSELANYSKIDIEYVNPSDITIGTQQGIININHWGKNGYATYRWTGYMYNQKKRTEYNNYLTTDKFVYSKYISLPEGQIPDEPYGVPTSYIKSDLKTDTYQFGYRNYYVYTFINNNGLCDGRFSIDYEYFFAYPTDTQELFKYFLEPTFKYDDFWSIQSTSEQNVINNVVGWDLSKLNYEIKDNVDTYVVFALNNSDTNYYYPRNSSNYRLGLLRNDSTLGKYVKDTDARVYSICSDSLENTNLSVNPQYPITFNQAGQNISLKDLINSSFDGRSIGEKNITGLVNRIKENIRRPSGNLDLVVATDNDITSTNGFIDSIKNSISSDVDVKTNIIDSSSFEDIDIWTKYVVKGDYKRINRSGVDADLILLGNGELWGRGTNSFAVNSGIYGYGLLCQDTTTTYHNSFVKIADNVKHAYLRSRNANTIYIVKNDGTLWFVGQKGLYMNPKTYSSEPRIYNKLTQMQEFTDVRSLAFGIFDTGDMFIVSGAGVFKYSEDWYWDLGFPTKDPYAPADTYYVYGGGDYQSSALYYITSTGSVEYSIWKYGEQQRGLYHRGDLSAPVKDISAYNTSNYPVIVCEDNRIYGFDCSLMLPVPAKQYVLDEYGKSWVIGENNLVYEKWSRYFSTYNFTADRILYSKLYNGSGIIYRDLDGSIKYKGTVSYANLLSEDQSLAGKEADNRGYPITIDVSVNNTAADYFQIGDKFCYVTKRGEICYKEAYNTFEKDYMNQYIWNYRTVNIGRFDALFHTPKKPIKAFSKTKLFKTELREGSERYFIYISDNVLEDTYIGEPSNYFLFGNLDYDILNYLNANKFNIYVVTPEKAHNIKLRYPNVLNDIQQLSLKELIYYSVMDSAFCKDTDTVIKLISKRYDTYTKQGSTTLTLLVNEESVRYNQVYRDIENDPKHSERWLYTHDPTYFDNSNGLDSNSDKWVNEPLYTFSKVGKYTVYAQFRDNPPLDDNNFDNYRLWSNKSAPGTILVHRRPIALFSVNVSSVVGNKVNLSYLDQSYDLDHNISRPSDKGISARLWKYKKVDSDAWFDGKPSYLTHNSGIYEIELRVKDIEGAWSKPYTTQIDTSNLPPIINATPVSYEGYDAVDVTITADDLGENDFAYMRYALTMSDTPPTNSSSVWNRVGNGVKVKTITINEQGTFYLHMEAYDNVGLCGKNMAGPYVIIRNKPPQVAISKSLSYIYEGDNIEIYMRPVDPDNDTLDLVLEEKKDSGEWKTVLTKSACASGSTQIYSITKISAGNYQYRVTVTDPYGETASESLSFMAYPLGINGFVDHTPIWKSNWINYNKHQQNIGKPVFENDTFFTGEKYVLSATTTKISPDSNVTALNVSVKIIERTYSPVLLDKQSSNYFTGEMWNEDMRGTRWRGKQATFLFTVTYSNGTVKTDSVVTNIIDDDYFRVKMSF